jgi:hypothetical protein
MGETRRFQTFPPSPRNGRLDMKLSFAAREITDGPPSDTGTER